MDATNPIDIVFPFAGLMPTQDNLHYAILQDVELIEGGGKRSRVIGFGLTFEEVGQIWGGN